MIHTISTDELIDSIISYLEDMSCHISLDEEDYKTLYLELILFTNIIRDDYIGGDKL